MVFSNCACESLTLRLLFIRNQKFYIFPFKQISCTYKFTMLKFKIVVTIQKVQFVKCQIYRTAKKYCFWLDISRCALSHQAQKDFAKCSMCTHYAVTGYANVCVIILQLQISVFLRHFTRHHTKSRIRKL